MDITQIETLITSIGFPIVACIFMFKYNTEELKELRSAIQENTEAINKLCYRYDSQYGGGSDNGEGEENDENS